MKRNTNRKGRSIGSRLALLAFVALNLAVATESFAQVPPRFYWKSLSNANGMPLIFQSVSGNTNPFDNARTVTPGADFDASVAVAGYARTFSMFDRAAMVAVLLPMGRISGDVTVGGRTFNQATNGFGDPLIELDVNIIGPEAQKNIPDMLRYEPGFSLDLLADLALPIGEYDEDQPLNIGQNRWYGRVGAPTIIQIGPWIPGDRTTLELLPSVWFFGNNDDYVGQTLETDPLFQLDAHLTRDFTEHLWGSLDFVWLDGGKASIDGVDGASLSTQGVGLTLGYGINDNLNVTMAYKSTINDSNPEDLRMDTFVVSLVYGWHPLIEGSRRLRASEG